jgi:hypothetical protein
VKARCQCPVFVVPAGNWTPSPWWFGNFSYSRVVREVSVEWAGRVYFSDLFPLCAMTFAELRSRGHCIPWYQECTVYSCTVWLKITGLHTSVN